jgi:hypothetical protein
MLEPDLPSDGMEPGIEPLADPFAVALDMLEAACDAWMIDHPDSGRNELIHAMLLRISFLIAGTYNVDQRRTWQVLQSATCNYLDQESKKKHG